MRRADVVSGEPSRTSDGLPPNGPPLPFNSAPNELRSNRSASFLRVAFIAAFAMGLSSVMLAAAGSVTGARRATTLAEARTAASLWELAGKAAVDELFGDRATASPVEEQSGTGSHAYTAGELSPSRWISITEAPGTKGLPALPILLSLAGILLAILWAAGRSTSARKRRVASARVLVAAVLAVATLASVALTAHGWAGDRLEDLGRARVTLGLSAAEIAHGRGTSLGDAARATGLPWSTDANLDQPDDLWTMPRPVAAAVAGSPARDLESYTVRSGGAIYHGGSVVLAAPPLDADPSATPDPPSPTRLHLAFLGYRETASPAFALLATAAGAAVLLGLILYLLPLATRPRILGRTLAAWGFIAPAGALLLVFTAGPLVASLWISLHDWHLADPAHQFVGIDNYTGLLGDSSWWRAIRNTALFTLHVPVAMAVALSLAILTRGSKRAVRWARLALFLPAITSIAAIAVVWKWVLNDAHGLANRLLGVLGLGPVAWLSSPSVALVSLMLISVWMVVGYQMVVFQAGLAAIPQVWYDAARVDGAGPFQRLRYVTLPGLRHTLFFVLVTSVIGSFQVFSLVYVMTEGGPLGSTDVAVYHIYREAWEFLRFGDAAAMSWVLFLVVLAATWLHFRLMETRRAQA